MAGVTVWVMVCWWVDGVMSIIRVPYKIEHSTQARAYVHYDIEWVTWVVQHLFKNKLPLYLTHAVRDERCNVVQLMVWWITCKRALLYGIAMWWFIRCVCCGVVKVLRTEWFDFQAAAFCARVCWDEALVTHVVHFCVVPKKCVHVLNTTVILSSHQSAHHSK